MIPFFDRFDAIPEPRFALWCALGMLGVGLVIGAILAVRWVVRKAAGRRRKHRHLRKLYNGQLRWERRHGRRRW